MVCLEHRMEEKSMELNDYVGKKIKEVRLSRGMTQDDLAIKLDTTRQTVSRYETGDRKANQDVLFKLSEVFNVKIDEFFPNEDNDGVRSISTIYTQLTPPRQKKVYSFAEQQLEEQNKQHSVTTYGPVAAGTALEYGDGFIEERNVSYVPDKAERALVVKGKSMEPDFPDGSVVFYIEQPMVENGEIAIVEINKEAVTCKRIKFDYENQKIVLQSLNPEYGDMQFESHEVKVLGKVVK